MKGVSDLELRLLTTVAEWIYTRGFQPSYRELAEAWGWASPGYVHQLACALEKKKFLKRRGSRALEFDWQAYLREESRGCNRKAVANGR